MKNWLKKLKRYDELTSVKNKLKGNTEILTNNVSKIIKRYSDANYWNLEDRLDHVMNGLNNNLTIEELESIQDMNASLSEDYFKRIFKLSTLEYEQTDISKLIENQKGKRKEVINKYGKINSEIADRIKELKNKSKTEKLTFKYNPTPLRWATGLVATSMFLPLKLNSYSIVPNQITDEAIEELIRKNEIVSIMPRSKPYIDLVFEESSKYDNVDPEDIVTIMSIESHYKPNAISIAGAKGLMQLMDETAKGLGVKNSFNPSQNIFGGTLYFSQLMEKYDNNKKHAIPAYNAGPTKVDEWIKNGKIKNIPFKETKNYLRRFLSKRSKFS